MSDTPTTKPALLSAEDRIAIHELTTSYGIHHDRRDFDSLRACFSPDASYVLRVTDGPTYGPHVGRDAIIAQIRSFKEKQSDVRRHHISNIQVDPTGPDEASVLSYVMVSATSGKGLTIKTVGTYSDGVVRTPGGWKIARKELQLDSDF